MKISRLFHWLYAFLLTLPLVSSFWLGLIWTFNENAQVPTITEYVGKEVDFNQLVGDLNTNVESPYNGIGFTISDDKKSVTFNGTATSAVYLGFSFNTPINYVSGHKYLLKGNFGLSNASFFIENPTNVGYGVYDFISVASTDLLSSGGIGLRIDNGANLVNVKVTPTLYDLTQMFGSGNEPTIIQFNEWFSDDYYDYTLSTHLVIDNYSTKETLDNPINYIWLPSFGGMGWSIQNVMNYLVGNMFGLVVSSGIGLAIVKLLTYWLCISLIWLVFDVIMYVPLLIHRYLDKGVLD